MVLGAFIMARSIRSTTDLIPGVQLAIGYIPPLADYLPFALAASILYVLICALNNLYSFRYRRSPAREFGAIVMISTTWIMLLIAYFFMRRDLFFSRLVMGYVWILSMGLVFAGRMILRGVHRLLVKRGRGVSRLLFIGNNTISKTLYQHLRRR